MLRFHHVNLGVPVDCEDAEEDFLVRILGYRRASTPAGLDGLVRWFEGDDGSQVHLSEDPDHRPAARAHVAVEIGEELPALEGELNSAGFDCTALVAEGRRLLFCRDPAGNRWELRGPADVM
jgi:catechol 2,3-dioxygenase-like lactoylglutathione lyase family enzyme